MDRHLYAPRKFTAVIVLLALLIGGSFFSLTAPTARADVTWNKGDIFAGVGNGNYNIFDHNGNFKQTINNSNGSEDNNFSAGCAFNPAQSLLYATDWTHSKVVTFDTSDPHAIKNDFQTNADNSNNESIVFAANGDYYVGDADQARIEPSLLHYNSNNVLQKAFNAKAEKRGIDWIDLSSDQKTIFYTSEGRSIMRYDVSGDGAQLPDFALLPPQPNDGRILYALRLLPPGDGSGGLLVAANADILRLDASGQIVQTYDAPGVSDWFGLNLDPDGTHFWSGSIGVSGTADIYEFQITGSSTPVQDYKSKSRYVGGLCIKGESPAGLTPPAPPPPPPGRKLIFDNDTWIGNKSVTVSDNLAVTDQAVMVNGKNQSPGQWVTVPNYTHPTSGKLVWDNAADQMIEQARATYLRTDPYLPEREQACPDRPIHDLYLEWGRDIYSGQPIHGYDAQHPPNEPYVLFQFSDMPNQGNFPNGCRYILDTSTVIHGTGTIVSTSRSALLNWQPGQVLPGATFLIKGLVHFADDNGTLGIVNFGISGGNGLVEIAGGNPVRNLAVFTNGDLRIDPNQSNEAEILAMQAVARHIIFPKGKDLTANIIFRNAGSVATRVPPLFETEKLPIGRELP